MAASAGTILKDFKEEMEKILPRHEHALGYAPGMDLMEMDDWSRLNNLFKDINSTYSELASKYAWQIGLSYEDLGNAFLKCYDEAEKHERAKKPFNILACKKHEAMLLKAQKGMPL